MKCRGGGRKRQKRVQKVQRIVSNGELTRKKGRIRTTIANTRVIQKKLRRVGVKASCRTIQRDRGPYADVVRNARKRALEKRRRIELQMDAEYFYL
jgi:hypothetical protein